MMEVFSFFVLITVIVFFAISYTTLPERIPMAFSGSGEPVEGGKIYFLITFWLGFCSYGLLFMLKRFPRLRSYPVVVLFAGIFLDVGIYILIAKKNK